MDYTYKILDINTVTNFMDVEYDSVGFDPIVVGMAVPTTGVKLDDYIAIAAPIQQWTKTINERAPIEIGTTGTLKTLSISI